LKTKTFNSTLKNALAYYNAGFVAVNLEVVGLAPVLRCHVYKLKNVKRYFKCLIYLTPPESFLQGSGAPAGVSSKARLGQVRLGLGN
jgi:hypothetical protein